ncbi:MAG: glutamine synthetase, partial [Mycobacterium sp.]
MIGLGSAMLTVADLQRLVASDEIDTVVLAFTDMQGRLVGKRVAARHFVEEVADHGAECCSYLLAADVEMNTVPGYPIADWGTGYGDMVMTPDFATLRRIPWLPGTAQVLADLYRPDGSPVTVSPRQILATQIDRLAERG